MSRLKITLGALVLAALTPPAAMAQGSAGPPGPPPENGLRLPAPPGTVQPFVPPGPPVTVPAQPTGRGLLNAAGATFSTLWSGSADRPKHSSGMRESSRK